MLKEFKEFALRGNVIDMAVGIIIGGAFGTIVKSLVSDVIMPPIGLLLGGIDFSNLFALLKAGDPAGPYASLADAQAAGAVTINYGVFLDNIVSFILVALAVFFLIRAINQLQRKEEEAGLKIEEFVTTSTARGRGGFPEDPLLETARELAHQSKHVSTSFLQRRLRIGYPRAARIMEQLEEESSRGEEPSG